MARIGIYVPEELKARMDEAGEVNWSAAAQQAFEAEINANRWKTEVDVIEKTIARLRASKEQADAKMQIEGRKAGQEWARDTADYRALKAVAECNLDAAYAWETVAILVDGDTRRTGPR